MPFAFGGHSHIASELLRGWVCFWQAKTKVVKSKEQHPWTVEVCWQSGVSSSQLPTPHSPSNPPHPTPQKNESEHNTDKEEEEKNQTEHSLVCSFTTYTVYSVQMAAPSYNINYYYSY